MIAQLDRTYLRTRPLQGVRRLVSYALFEGRPLTTRGRWINPLVLGHLRAAAHAPQLRAVQRPAFILGTGRSGTTILGKLLSMHRDIAFLNEPKALWHVIHAEEDVIGSYTRGPGRYRLTEADATIERRQAARRIYGYYLAVTGTRQVLDKYPELMFRVPFVRALFPDARLLLLVRHGRDTIESIEHWSERLGRDVGGEVHDWWGRDGRKWRLMTQELVPSEPLLAGLAPKIAGLTGHVDRAAVEWILTMQQARRTAALHPDQSLLVRYEDLVGSPRTTLAEILAFLGRPADPVVEAYAERTLRPAPPKRGVRLDPVLVPAFEATLEALGYA